MSHRGAFSTKKAKSIASALARDKAFAEFDDIVATRRRTTSISTGSPTLDLAIGIGGWPLARLSILHGGEATGKTTIALEAVAQWQRAGGVVLYADVEHALDLDYLARVVPDPEGIILTHPPYIEKGFELFAAFIDRARAASVDAPLLIVLDSLQAWPAMRTFNGEYDRQDYGPEANAYSRVLRKFTPKLSTSNTAMIAISQVRTKMDGWGNSKEKVGVGQAPLFYASVIADVKSKTLRGTTAEGVTGNHLRVRVVKNKVAPPFRTAEFEIIFGKGFDRVRALVDCAKTIGVARALKGKILWTIDGAKADASGRAYEWAADDLSSLLVKAPDLYDGLFDHVHDLLVARPDLIAVEVDASPAEIDLDAPPADAPEDEGDA